MHGQTVKGAVMELVKQLIPILLTLSLSLLVLSIGMASQRGDLVHVLRRPARLARAVIAVSVIPPLAAVIIVALFPISHPAKVGLLLMAISPVPPLVPGKELKFGGRQEYVYGLYTAMALLSIVTVPLLGQILGAYYDSPAQFPPAVVGQSLLVSVIIPCGIGLALGRWLAPHRAHHAAPVIGKIGLFLVLIAFIPIVAASWQSIVSLVGDGTIVAIILFVVISIAGGHFLGGSDIRDRSTLAFAAAMRHPGIALALAGANHADKRVSAAVLLVLLVGMVTLIPYQKMIKRRLAAADEGDAASMA